VTALLLALALQAAPASTTDEAKALFKDGETAYNLGQFDVALQKYTDAYKLKPLPGFLFNMAQCHKQLGNYERAAFFFGRFVDTSPPKAPNVDVAKGLLDEMKAKQKEVETKAADQKNAEEAKKADDARKADADKKAQDELKIAQLTPNEPVSSPLVPPMPPPQVVEDTPTYKKGWFWGVVVGAVVVVGAGVTVGVIAANQKSAPMGTLPTIYGR
jgi:tetratricopeptide (TPR) repeat protein